MQYFHRLQVELHKQEMTGVEARRLDNKETQNIAYASSRRLDHYLLPVLCQTRFLLNYEIASACSRTRLVSPPQGVFTLRRSVCWLWREWYTVYLFQNLPPWTPRPVGCYAQAPSRVYSPTTQLAEQ